MNIISLDSYYGLTWCWLKRRKDNEGLSTLLKGVLSPGTKRSARNRLAIRVPNAFLDMFSLGLLSEELNDQLILSTPTSSNPLLTMIARCSMQYHPY